MLTVDYGDYHYVINEALADARRGIDVLYKLVDKADRDKLDEFYSFLTKFEEAV